MGKSGHVCIDWKRGHGYTEEKLDISILMGRWDMDIKMEMWDFSILRKGGSWLY